MYENLSVRAKAHELREDAVSNKRVYRQILTGILVALNGGSVALKLDDLTDESIPADLD